jgi:phage-related protein
MKCNEFWDSFESAVHNNKKLSSVEKFNYLKSKLQGDAKYSGLNLSNENYDVAVKTLKERFGNVQDVIDMHYNQMINLWPPINKTVSLRIFLDKLIKHLRSLEVLKQDTKQNVFVPMVRSKLPEDVLLQLEIQKGSHES